MKTKTTTYEEKVERMAKELWAKDNPAHSWFTFGKPYQDRYRKYARECLHNLGVAK